MSAREVIDAAKRIELDAQYGRDSADAHKAYVKARDQHSKQQGQPLTSSKGA